MEARAIDKDWILENMERKTISDFSKILLGKLQKVNPDTLILSDYYRYYVKRVSWLSFEIQKYSYILWLALRDIDDYRNIVLVDYGGGAGLLSLLAKEIGIKTVVYDDIDNNTCRDAQVIGKGVGIPADYYNCGDIDDLIDFLSANNLDCDVLVSYDVLEHIYDIESYLRKLKFLSKRSLRLVMCSGANQYNPYIKHSIVKLQNKLEYHGRIGEIVTRENDCRKSFYESRIDIIRNNSPQLDNKTLALLAQRTRGMRVDDILNVISNHKTYNAIPVGIEHQSNTCDPYSGNWEEHLMDPYNLKSILKAEGFQVKLLSGLWFSGNKIYRRVLANILNIPIRISKNNDRMLPISPFYIIYASTNC